MKLQLCLGQCPPHAPQHHPPRPHRPPGPSRLRRRARRAAAAEEVNAPGKLVAEEFAILHPTSADVSVKVAVNVPSADAAAQVALLVPPIPATHTAAHPSLEVHDHPHEAAPSQCDDPPKHDVQDMFCPDSQYLTVRQSIPQLDGSTDAFQCDNCQKFFQIRDQLADHSKIHQFGCDDCGICYIWLHILAATTQKHPSSFHQA